MKHLLAILLVAGLWVIPGFAADSIAVTDHEIVGFGSKVDLTPKQIMVTLEVEYTLSTKSTAVLRLAIDREAEMKFAVIEEQPVVAGRKKQKSKIRFLLNDFKRDMLRGIVLLADPSAGDGAKALAMTGLSLDVKRFKNG